MKIFCHAVSLFSIVEVCWLVIYRKNDEYKEIIIAAGKTHEVRLYCFLQELFFMIVGDGPYISVCNCILFAYLWCSYAQCSFLCEKKGNYVTI